MWFETAPADAGEVVEAELLPVPGPVARPLGSRAGSAPPERHDHGRTTTTTHRDRGAAARRCQSTVGSGGAGGSVTATASRVRSRLGRLGTFAAAAATRRPRLVLLTLDLGGVGDRLRARRVRLEVGAVDRLGHEQELREAVEQVAVLLQEPLGVVVRLVQEPRDLLVDQLGRSRRRSRGPPPKNAFGSSWPRESGPTFSLMPYSVDHRARDLRSPARGRSARRSRPRVEHDLLGDAAAQQRTRACPSARARWQVAVLERPRSSSGRAPRCRAG